MDHSNRNRTPAELEATEAALRAERHEATPLELDAIKLQAIRQAERSRPSLFTNGAFMKSRLALTLLLVAGFMLSTTGATLAISGSSGSGSAASTQYVPPGSEGEHKGGNNHPEQGVKGAHEKSGKCTEGGSNGGSGGNGANGGGNSGANGNGGNDCTKPANTNTLEPAPEVEVAPATAEQTAVVSSGSSLPFTGFVAIPLLVIGLALIVGGAVLGIKSRKDPVARP
jgi:hypothetical protein